MKSCMNVKQEGSAEINFNQQSSSPRFATTLEPSPQDSADTSGINIDQQSFSMPPGGLDETNDDDVVPH